MPDGDAGVSDGLPASMSTTSDIAAHDASAAPYRADHFCSGDPGIGLQQAGRGLATKAWGLAPDRASGNDVQQALWPVRARRFADPPAHHSPRADPIGGFARRLAPAKRHAARCARGDDGAHLPARRYRSGRDCGRAAALRHVALEPLVGPARAAPGAGCGAARTLRCRRYRRLARWGR